MPIDLLDRVRADCAEVAEGAGLVRIRTDRLAGYAAALPVAAEARPTFDAEHHFRSGEDATALSVLCLDAVNFGSGWFPVFRKRSGLSGYHSVAVAIRDWFLREPVDAERLGAIEVDEVTAIFGQRHNAEVVDLMALFTRALNELGRELSTSWQGNARGLIAEADHSAARLVELLAALPSFRDVAEWRGRTVNLWKRAQLTAVDLSLALAGQGLGRFDDLGRLTIFADNLVPHVLRVDGLLEYHPQLLRRIEAGERLDPGETGEVELRACSVHAVELLRNEIGDGVTAADLDFLLWNRGQRPIYRQRPRHRARTTAY